MCLEDSPIYIAGEQGSYSVVLILAWVTVLVKHAE